MIKIEREGLVYDRGPLYLWVVVPYYFYLKFRPWRPFTLYFKSWLTRGRLLREMRQTPEGVMMKPNIDIVFPMPEWMRVSEEDNGPGVEERIYGEDEPDE